MRSVPESSPRETKRACVAAIFRRAASTSSAAAHPGRIAFRADEDKVVVHHVTPFAAVAGGDEGLFGLAIMDQNDVDIAVFRQLEGLARTDRDDMHLDSALPFELRQDGAQETGIVGAGGRRQAQIACFDGARMQDKEQDECCCQAVEAYGHDGTPFVFSSPACRRQAQALGRALSMPAPRP
jgi:hypothetical protein